MGSSKESLYFKPDKAYQMHGSTFLDCLPQTLTVSYCSSKIQECQHFIKGQQPWEINKNSSFQHALNNVSYESFQWVVVQRIIKVYMADFLKFICSIKSPQCTDMYSKEKLILIAIFLPLVLMYQKRQISLPVGYKTARPKTGDWE